jgi:glycosyltransferase involved in cell wall biosynthesis
MDGIEWRRDKWGAAAKTWFWLNEHAGAWLGNHLVADHPGIARHLQRLVPAAKITTIPYGADQLRDLPEAPVLALGLQPGRYATLIARPEPENSVLEVVQAWSKRPRGAVLAVLGAYRDDNAYHRAVRKAAGPEVKFLGAIYDRAVVQALRWHSLIYVHGHRVGGTNPSLVEALGAGNAVVAHDNPFNRWVAGASADYFSSPAQLDLVLNLLLVSPDRMATLQGAAVSRFLEAFRWETVLSAYEQLMESACGSGKATAG